MKMKLSPHFQDDSLAEGALELVHEAAAELEEKSKAEKERYIMDIVFKNRIVFYTCHSA